jgi:molecular chaperone GrpE
VTKLEETKKTTEVEEEVKEDKKENKEEKVEKTEETKKTEEKVEPEKKEENEEAKKIEKLSEEVKKLQAEADDWKNKYYRVYADSDNIKRRLQNEASQASKYRIQSFALEVLPALDNLDRALDQETTDKAMATGVKMIRDQIWQALKDEGISEIDALGKPFDGNFHHAIMKEKVEGKEPGTVIEVLQKGYMLKDRILRAALVKVAE